MKPTVAFPQMLMLSTSLLCLSSYAAQTSTQSPTGDQKQGMATEKKKSCMVADNPHRFVIKHIESKGVGYDQGYTSLDAFFTGNVCNFVPFIDLRAHVFNNGRWAGNAGIGTRYVLDPCKSMVGINAYYDYRKTKNFHYNQVGAGIEAYYDRFEFLANGYLPVGSKRTRTEHELQSIEFKRFSGNYILYSKYYKNKYEGAMKGFDAEVGGHFAGDMKNYDLYFGIGPYYYDLSKDRQAWGGRARIKLEISKWLFLEGIDTWDRIFHNRVQGSVTFNVPFGVKRCYGKKKMANNQYQTCDNVMDWLAVLPVDRQEIIVVDKYKKKQVIDPVAIDPATGNPFYVIFVDNTNPGIGDGTFENPFSYLTHNDAAGSPNAQDNSFANNTIYVFPGDGTNARQAAGMVLPFEGQRMLGSAIPHTYVTTDGVLTIPAQSTKTPFITGTVNLDDGVAVNFNNCEVSGFNIAMQTPFPAGNQAFRTTGVACINVGNGDINADVLNVIVTNNSCVNETYGINLGTADASTVQGNVIINNNICSIHAGNGGAVGGGISIRATKNATIQIANNQLTCNPFTSLPVARGIDLTLSDQVQAVVQNNIVNSTTDAGVSITWLSPTNSGLTGTAVVQNNTISNTGTQGISVTSQARATIPGSIKAIVLDNTVLSQTSASQFVLTSSMAVPNPALLVRFIGNTMPNALPTVNFNTGTGAAAALWVEPTANNTCSFTVSGTNPIIPIVPCQYGGPACP